MRIAIIGAGSWGTALALVAARANHEVLLWTRDADRAAAINRERINPQHLSDFELPHNIRATSELDYALTGASLATLVLPSHATRGIARRVASSNARPRLIVGATKGIEIETSARISEVVAEEFADGQTEFVALSGPSFAREVADDLPTAIVAAGKSAAACLLVRRAFGAGSLRVYTNDDLAGVELGGAAKNTIALAAGMCDGVGLGANSRAALITRGLAELTRLAVRFGGRTETLAGLAGLGDLVLTCTGSQSRNRFVGEQLGRGRALADVLAGMSEVAEGVRTTVAVRNLAEQGAIEMPITEQVYQVLHEGKPVTDAVADLLGRPPKEEFERENAAAD